MRFLGASGQLGYGIPTPAFNAGLARKPDLIGCDMGSIDIGPTYLGKGEMATAPAATRRDLRKVLLGARSIDVPLVIGSAGSAGAAPHLEATLAIIREIARAEGLHFRLGVLRADLSRDMLRAAVRAGRVRGIDDMPALTEEEVTEAAHIVGQMGMGPFRRALAEDVDVLIAGRACDTAIFASLPTMLGFPAGLSVHMAKIIECASLCCLPGGRDSILATLDDDGFVLESMARAAARDTGLGGGAQPVRTGRSVHGVRTGGQLDLSGADYAAVDDRRMPRHRRGVARVNRSVREDRRRAADRRARGAAGGRGRSALHRAASRDPAGGARPWCATWCARTRRRTTRCASASMAWMACAWRRPRDEPPPGEVFVMGECIAPTAERAAEVVRTLQAVSAASRLCGAVVDRGQSGVSVHAARGFAWSGVPVQRVSPAAHARSGRAVPAGDRDAVAGTALPLPPPARGGGEEADSVADRRRADRHPLAVLDHAQERLVRALVLGRD